MTLSKKKEVESRRHAPDTLKNLLSLLNDLPRTDEEVAIFLVRYEQAVTTLTWGEFLERYADGRDARTVDEIGMADREYATEVLGELRLERLRLIDIISVFNQRVRGSITEPKGRLSLRHLSMRLNVPLTKLGFDPYRRSLTLRQSPAITLLMETNAFAVLERLIVCPICEDIKWLMKTATTASCGKQQCRDRVAYIRKKYRDGKTFDDEEQKIFDQIGPSRTYQKGEK